MTEESKAKVKVRVLNFAKLAAAIGALTAAINGYVQVRRDQDNLLQVMSDKLDSIVLKVAYLEGRVDGLAPKEAAEKAEERVLPAPVVTDADVPPPSSMIAIPTPGAIETPVSKEDAKLYRQMPRDFEAIQMVIERKLGELPESEGAQP